MNLEELSKIEQDARNALADLGFVEANHCCQCPRGQASWMRAGIHALARALQRLKDLIKEAP